MAATGEKQHVVMEFSGHRTPSMLRRYHIIGLDDLRAAAERASEYQGAPSRVGYARWTAPEQPQHPEDSKLDGTPQLS
jgi:hypothetical protein